MLREVQREVNMNHPFQSRLHSGHSTKNHHSQLLSTDYPFCGSMACSLMEKTAGTQNCEKTLEQQVWAYTEWTKMNKLRRALILRVLRSCWGRRLGRNIQIQRTLTFLWLHHETEVRQSVRVLVLQNKDRWIRPTDLSWPFPVLVTIRELPFRNLSWKVNCEFGSQGWSQEAEESEKQNSQIKHTGIRLGSRIPIGNEILFMDFLGNVIHGDENNVFLSRTTTLHHYCHLPFWWWHVRPLSLVVVSQARHFVFPFCEGLSMTLAQGLRPNSSKVILRSVCHVTIGRPWNYPCFRSSYSLDTVSKSILDWRESYIFLFLVVCFLVSSPRTSCTYRTLYIHSVNRDVLCQLPPEAGHPPEIASRLKKPAYGMSDAPWRWWNVLDKALCSCGVVPTRADRCGYVLYSNVYAKLEQNVLHTRAWHKWHLTWIVCAMTGRCSIWENVGTHWRKSGKSAAGIINFFRWPLRKRWNRNGTTCPSQTYKKTVFKLVQKNGMTCSSQDKEFVGSGIFNKDQALRSAKNRLLKNWTGSQSIGAQKEDPRCTPTMHTRYRSLAGQINWFCSVGRSPSVVTRFPDVLQRQLLQHLMMWSLLTSWQDNSRRSQWNFNSGHSQDRWE